MSYGYVPTPLPPPPVSRPSWFSRNWKWFLPTVIIGPLLLVALFIGGIASMVFGMIKSSEPYQHAVGVAASDPRVVSQLGAPITPGWFPTGNINVSNSSGNADLSIPLNGSRHHGTVHVVARKSGGVWRYQKLDMITDGHEVGIDLLPTPSGPVEEKEE